MKKIILISIFIAIIAIPLFAEEINPEQKYIVTGEQIILWQYRLTNLKQNINELIYKLNEKEIEILTLKSAVEEWKYKYERSRKGFWAGLGTGYPLGGQGIILYQFNEKFGIFSVGGFNGMWSINAGIVMKIK